HFFPTFPSHPPSRPSSQQHPFVPVNCSASLLHSDSQRQLRRFLSRSRQLSLRLTPGQALNTPGAFPGLLEAFETRMDEEEWPKQRVALICVEATFQVGKRGNGGRRGNIGGKRRAPLDDLFDTLESFPQLLTLNSDTPNAKTECELLLLLLDDLFDTLESYPQLLHDMRFALRLPMGVLRAAAEPPGAQPWRRCFPPCARLWKARRVVF
ncbi:unnamed protein product, partial [Closterium sp. NIES-64]